MNCKATLHTSDFIFMAAGSEAASIAAPYRSFAISNWLLLASDTLPVSRVFDARGRDVGLLLGYWLSSECEGQLSPASLTIPLEIGTAETDDLAEWLLIHCLGRYAFILAPAEGGLRFYPDASGSLSAVFQNTSRTIASRPALCHSTVESSNEDELSDELRNIRLRSGTWYPLGFCGGSDIRVILPNHYLNVEAWRIRRFWSYGPVLIDERAGAIERAIRTISDDIARVITCVDRYHPLTLSLTSGRDSRMVLACCPRHILRRVSFHTLPDHSEADVQVARLLAAHFSLSLDVKDNPPSNRVLVQGVGGEVGRCFYWKETDFRQTEPTIDDLTERLGWGDVSHPLVRKALTEWMSGLKGASWLRVLDLAYIELRVACAHAPAMYDHDRVTMFSLYPMNSRSIFSAMLSLPEKWRYRHGLFRSVIKLNWSELITFPLHSSHWTSWGKYRALLSYVRYRSRWNEAQRMAFMKVATANRSFTRTVADDVRRVTRRVGSLIVNRRSG